MVTDYYEWERQEGEYRDVGKGKRPGEEPFEKKKYGELPEQEEAFHFQSWPQLKDARMLAQGDTGRQVRWCLDDLFDRGL